MRSAYMMAQSCLSLRQNQLVYVDCMSTSLPSLFSELEWHWLRKWLKSYSGRTSINTEGLALFSYRNTRHMIRVQERAKRAFLNAHVAHGVHTGKTWRGFFFFLILCLLAHVRHLQLMQNVKAVQITQIFFFHRNAIYDWFGVM